MQHVELDAIAVDGTRHTLMVGLDPRSCIDQVWSVSFGFDDRLRVVGDLVGCVSSFQWLPNTVAVLEPINPIVGRPYFRLELGDSLRGLMSRGLRSFEFSTKAQRAEWRTLEAEAASDRVHQQMNAAVAEVAAPPAVQPTTAGALELCVEIGGYEGVTVRVDGIAPADFDAVCQSVRAAFLANVA